MKLAQHIIDLPTPETDGLLPTTRALMASGADKFHRHRFDVAYHHVFKLLDRTPSRILEIGVYKGHSHNAWRALFPRSTIVGFDIRERPATLHPDVHHFQGDQGNRAAIESCVGTFGPFDLIIEDGSHTMAHQRDCYRWLWPHLVVGGIYVCEDLHTSQLCERAGDEGAGYQARFNPTGETELARDLFLAEARDRVGRRGERCSETGSTTLYPDRMHLFFSAMVAIKKLHDGGVKEHP